MIYNIKFQAIGFQWPVHNVELFEASVDQSTTLMEILLFWQEDIAFYQEIGFYYDRQCTLQITQLHTTFGQLKLPQNTTIFCKQNELSEMQLIQFDNNIDIHVYLEQKHLIDIELNQEQTLKEIINQLKYQKILSANLNYTYALTDFNRNIISTDPNFQFNLKHKMVRLEIKTIKLQYTSKINQQNNDLSQTILPDSKVEQSNMIYVNLYATTFKWQQQDKTNNKLRIKLNIDSTIKHFIDKLIQKGVLYKQFNICLSKEIGINKLPLDTTFKKQNIQKDWTLYLQE